MNFRKCYFNICLFFSVDSSSWVFKKTQKTWESGLSLKLDEKAWERNSRNTEVTADAKNILINLRLWIAFNKLGPHPYFSLITADWESTNWSCGLGTASEGTGSGSQADLMRSDWIGKKGEKNSLWRWRHIPVHEVWSCTWNSDQLSPVIGHHTSFEKRAGRCKYILC